MSKDRSRRKQNLQEMRGESKKQKMVTESTEYHFFGLPLNKGWYNGLRIGFIFALIGTWIGTSIQSANFTIDLIFTIIFSSMGGSGPNINFWTIVGLQTFPMLVFWIILDIFVGIVRMQVKKEKVKERKVIMI